ncbi:MAG: NAD(+) synthase [Oscillospiraceae bacterium]|nr:NAD(+) synthase [Oscillospiraceae bacterium]
MYKFDAVHATEQCVNWIKEWFEENGKGCNAVLGISGGKDSSIVAALCVKALGKDRVIGVLMPKGEQFDINYSEELCDFLDIKRFTINIKEAEDAIYNAIGNAFEITNQTKFNLPPRIRMSVVYAVAQSNNGRVANTCNLSEDWVGYSTRYGDSVGDFSPLSCFTVTEVKQMGRVLGLPEKFIEKPPIDGLCGKTDEDNLGFTYAALDKYIREGIEPPAEIKTKIDTMHKNNLFKLKFMPCFSYDANK